MARTHSILLQPTTAYSMNCAITLRWPIKALLLLARDHSTDSPPLLALFLLFPFVPPWLSACCCSTSSGMSACCSPGILFSVLGVKTHEDGQQATRGGLLRCIEPYGGR